LNEKEAANVGTVIDRLVERPWELWKNRVLSRTQQQ
jgi:hypothetical protein